MVDQIYGDVNVLARQMELFGEINPNMPYMTTMALIFVATRGRCHQKDFENEFQLNEAMASRSISYWCEDTQAGDTNRAFIDRREDPMNRRFRLLTLTAKGQAFADKLRLGKRVTHG